MSIWRLIISPKARRLFGSYGCLDETELAAYADKNLDEKAADRTVRHLGTCVECREQLAFLVHMQRPANAMEPPSAWLARVEEITNKPAKAHFRWQLATAAVGLAMAILMFVILPRPAGKASAPSRAASIAPSPVVVANSALPSKPNMTHDVSDRDVERNAADNQTVAIIAPMKGSHISDQSRLRWRPVDGAVYYEVKLLTKDGDLIFQSKEEEPAAHIPDDLLITEKQEVFLMVYAHLADGKTIASQAVRLILTPRS